MLPAWVGWLNLLYVPVAFVSSLSLQGVLAWITAVAHARTAGRHWTERARRTFPLVSLARRVSLLLCALFGLVAVLGSGPLSHVGPAILAPALVAAILAGSFWPSWRLAGRLRGTPPSAAAWFRTYVFAVLAASPLYLALFLACAFSPRVDAAVGVGLAFGVAFIVFINAGGLTRAGRTLGLLVPAPPALARAAATAASATGVRLRAAWLARVGYANAFALPLAREIVVTEPALQLFDEAELTAVCTHEMGHVGEGLLVGVSRLLVGIVVLSLAAIRPVYGSFGALAVLLMVVLAMLVFRLWPLLGRRLEHRSDETAHHHQAEPGTYARALEKLYAHELIPAVGYGKGGSHPHLYDRLQTAGAPPTYPRPAPPSRWVGPGAFVGIYLLLAPVTVAIGLVITTITAARSPALILLRIGALGGGGDALDALARSRWRQDRFEDALALEREAARVTPENLDYVIRVANYLALMHHCDESRRVSLKALALLGRHDTRGSGQAFATYGETWTAVCAPRDGSGAGGGGREP